MNMDDYISKSLKNWAASHPTPGHSRSRLLLNAASQNIHLVEPIPDPRFQNLFGRPLLDGAFGHVLITNLNFFNMSMISMRMMI